MDDAITGPAARLRAMRVRDVMTAEIVTCAADLPLDEAAGLMVRHRIHSVLVRAPSPRDPLAPGPAWAVVSDLDLVAAAPWALPGAAAGTVAASPRLVLHPDDSLAAAALAMAEHATAHMLVVDEGGGAPVGILSALDVARALTPVPERPAPAVS